MYYASTVQLMKMLVIIGFSVYSHALRTLSDLVRAVPTLFIAVQKYSIVSPSVKLSIVIVNIRLVVTLVLVSVIPSVTSVSTEFTTRLHMRVVMVFLGEEQVTLQLA